MVKDKIKALQGTKTILHIDNIAHYDLIIPHTLLKLSHRNINNGDLCINMATTCAGLLDFYKKNNYKNYKFITSTELISNQIHEVW